jgi:hypothetical protein
MTSTTIAQSTPTEDAVTRATTPFALSGVAHYLLDHDLPAPETIEVRRGRVRLWIQMQHVAAWKAHADVEALSDDLRGNHHLHIVDAVLHGSCVKVQLRWITFVDHQFCNGDGGACGRLLCYCRDVDERCESTVEPRCPHAGWLCDDHVEECTECVDDRRQDRVQSWGS